MKVAIVHDYLREYGGAERVVEALHEMWPSAPLYTSFVDWSSFGKAPKGKVEVFKSMDIRTSWVQHVWPVKQLISPLRFLAPVIWGSFDLSDYDVVISSSGWFMCRGVALRSAGPATCVSRQHPPPSPTFKGIFSSLLTTLLPSGTLRKSLVAFVREVRVAGRPSLASPAEHASPRRTRPLHISYIHHPPRNLYGYATGSDWQKYWPVRVYGTIVNFFLRQYDYRAAQAVDYFIANSEETARRVRKFYRRESTVIYPPIELSNYPIIQLSNKKNNAQKRYYLSVGRLTYAKRVDLAILACNKLKQPLKVVGTGKEEGYLRSIADPNVKFLGSVSDRELVELYAGAKALIFCALDEDFGMVAVEGMAAGTPVIALSQGGVKETVIDGKTGILFSKPEVEELVAVIQRLEDSKTVRWEEACRKQAKKFSKERFKVELKAFVEQKVQMR